MDTEANPLASDNPQAQLLPKEHAVSGSSASSEPLDEATKSAPDGPGLASSPAMDEAAKQDFLWHAHEYLNEYARFGDTKAGFAGTASAALLGLLYSAKAHVPIVQTTYQKWSFYNWLATGAIVFLSLSVMWALWTIWPRLRSTQPKGFIYWGSIAAHQRLELLQTSFHGQSARTLNDHLLHHAFDISTKVCTPKYRYVSLSIACLAIGGFLAAVTLVLQDERPPQADTNSAPAVQVQAPPASPIPLPQKSTPSGK